MPLPLVKITKQVRKLLSPRLFKAFLADVNRGMLAVLLVVIQVQAYQVCYT